MEINRSVFFYYLNDNLELFRCIFDDNVLIH